MNFKYLDYSYINDSYYKPKKYFFNCRSYNFKPKIWILFFEKYFWVMTSLDYRVEANPKMG